MIVARRCRDQVRVQQLCVCASRSSFMCGRREEGPFIMQECPAALQAAMFSLSKVEDSTLAVKSHNKNVWQVILRSVISSSHQTKGRTFSDITAATGVRALMKYAGKKYGSRNIKMQLIGASLCTPNTAAGDVSTQMDES